MRAAAVALCWVAMMAFAAYFVLAFFAAAHR